MATTTNLDTLKINYLTQAQYDAALENDEIDEDQVYLTPGSNDILANDLVVAGNASIVGALTVGGVDVPNCEHTVSSGSRYRYDFYKYSNGLLMIALYWGGTTTHYVQSLGGYGRQVSFNWGSDHAFNGLGYSCFHTWKVGSGFAEPAGMIKQSANAVNLYCVTNTTGEQSTEINMLCVGRWK